MLGGRGLDAGGVETGATPQLGKLGSLLGKLSSPQLEKLGKLDIDNYLHVHMASLPARRILKGSVWVRLAQVR
jgi:hypothetical protein